MVIVAKRHLHNTHDRAEMHYIQASWCIVFQMLTCGHCCAKPVEAFPRQLQPAGLGRVKIHLISSKVGRREAFTRRTAVLCSSFMAQTSDLPSVQKGADVIQELEDTKGVSTQFINP